MNVYKGLDDWHIPIFREVEHLTKAKHVLYPGCDKHVTASLFFPSVVYVDCNKKVEAVFKDEQVLEWVTVNKAYSTEPTIKFICKSFESAFEKVASFDLMISASAGIVSKPCSKYLKPGGYFLVSDAHFDARTTFLRPDFTLIGVYDMETKTLETSVQTLAGLFQTTKGSPINKSQVEESIKLPKQKRSFKLQKEAMFMFYLFQKQK